MNTNELVEGLPRFHPPHVIGELTYSQRQVLHLNDKNETFFTHGQSAGDHPAFQRERAADVRRRKKPALEGLDETRMSTGKS